MTVQSAGEKKRARRLCSTRSRPSPDGIFWKTSMAVGWMIISSHTLWMGRHRSGYPASGIRIAVEHQGEATSRALRVATLAHGHSDVGRLHRGHVVDPVAGDRHDLAP
jgi:hypothetical protein